MFGSNKKEARFTPGSTTLIASGTRVQGDLLFKGNLEIEGSVVGNLIAEDENCRVRILNGGSIEGEIRVPVVIVNGHVKGDIHAGKQLELAAKAIVEGNIHYQVLEIEKGAQVDGSFVHQQVAASNVSQLSREQQRGADKLKDG